jgi:hypothetical protein
VGDAVERRDDEVGCDDGAGAVHGVAALGSSEDVDRRVVAVGRDLAVDDGLLEGPERGLVGAFAASRGEEQDRKDENGSHAFSHQIGSSRQG